MRFATLYASNANTPHNRSESMVATIFMVLVYALLIFTDLSSYYNHYSMNVCNIKITLSWNTLTRPCPTSRATRYNLQHTRAPSPC